MLMNDKMLKHGEMSKYESSSNMNSDVVGMEIHRSTHGSKYCWQSRRESFQGFIIKHKQSHISMQKLIFFQN